MLKNHSFPDYRTLFYDTFVAIAKNIYDWVVLTYFSKTQISWPEDAL